MPDPEASAVLWLRHWAPLDPYPAYQTVSLIALASGPQDDIHFMVSCYLDVEGIPCESSRGIWSVHRTDGAGEDPSYFEVGRWAWGRAYMTVDGLNHVVTGTHTYFGTTGDTYLDVESFSPLGNPIWHFKSEASSGMVYGIAADVLGDVTFLADTANFWYWDPPPTTDYGGGPVAGAAIVNFSSSGEYRWHRELPYSITTPKLRASRGREVVLFDATPELSAALQCPPVADYPESSILLKLDASGRCLWARTFGEHTLGFTEVAVDPSGDLLISITGSSMLNFGSGPSSPIGATDITLARLSSTGDERWSKRLPGQTLTTTQLAWASNGQFLLSGGFSGDLDLGADVLHAEPESFYIARFSAKGLLLGQYLFSKTTDTLGDQYSLAADSNANAILLTKMSALELHTDEQTHFMSSAPSATASMPPDLLRTELLLAKIRIGLD